MKALRQTDSKMFGADWWGQPLPARYASIDAPSIGFDRSSGNSWECGTKGGKPSYHLARNG